MQLFKFLPRQGSRAPMRSRVTKLLAVLRAALLVEGYRDRLQAAGLHSPACMDGVDNLEKSVAALEPIRFAQYESLFPNRRPAYVRSPMNLESRSAYMLPYSDARICAELSPLLPSQAAELYSPHSMARATGDLYNLGRALQKQSSFDWNADHAVAAFSGLDAGILTPQQRDEFWNRYQVPVFEHFLGTDGRVIASECEIHAGLHIRPDAAIVECIDGELAITSLTDENTPALRVRSGFDCVINHDVCECGRTEPRILAIDTPVTTLAA